MASIFIMSGPRKGDYYPLGQRTMVVGRGESVPIQVLDELVSRRHVQIRFETADQRHHLLDMRSANGTFINGRRVSTDVALEDGDLIEIGNSGLMFSVCDFADRESAMEHYRQCGQRGKSTLVK